MAVNDVFQVILSHQVPGIPGTPSTGFYYRQTVQQQALEGVALCQDVSDAWFNTAQTDYLALLWDQATLIGLEVTLLQNPLFKVQVSADLAGTLAAVDNQGVSGRSAPVASFRTGLAGRSYRGRGFLMPVPEGFQSDGQLVVAYINLENTYWTGMREVSPPGILENVYSHTVYSKTLSEANQNITDNLVIDVIARPYLGSQRRRRKSVASLG